MMKTMLMSLRLLCLTLFFASAFGADRMPGTCGDLPRTLDAAPDGAVSIENTAGSVEVRGWSRNEVEVSGELGSDVEELVFERDGKRVTIEVRTPGGNWNHRDIASDLVVNVPEGSSINVDGISSDVMVRDVTGALRLNSVSGDIDAQAFASDIDAETVSGDVTIVGEGEQNRSRLHTVSGDVEAENLSGEIQAGTVSGDVTIVDGAFDTLRAESVSGDMVFRAALLDGGRMDMETINGELDVSFEGELSARFDIETFNGDINNCFGPEPVRTSEFAPGRELRFTEGDGGARITIHTLNGDLNLCKE